MNPPKDLELIETEYFDGFREGLYLFYNWAIRRYIVYKQYLSQLVKLCVVDGPNKEFREPGEWLFWTFRRADIFKAGSLDPERAINDYVEDLMFKDKATLSWEKKARELSEEANDAFKWLFTGRTSCLTTNRRHRRLNPKKIYGYDPRTDKMYKLRRKNGRS